MLTATTKSDSSDTKFAKDYIYIYANFSTWKLNEIWTNIPAIGLSHFHFCFFRGKLKSLKRE